MNVEVDPVAAGTEADATQPLRYPIPFPRHLPRPSRGRLVARAAQTAAVFTGTLGGAAMGREVIDFNADHVSVTNTGQSILVIDLSAFGDPAQFKQAVDTLVRDLRGSERLPDVERIWLPGEQSHEKRQRHAREGIPVVPVLLEELDALADDLGIERLQRGVRA